MEEEVKTNITQSNENNNFTSVDVQQKPSKVYRITNLVLGILLLAAEIFCITNLVTTTRAIITRDAGALFAAALAIIPIIMITTAGVFVFAIIMTVIAKKQKKYLNSIQLKTNILDKLCLILPWVFLLIDLLGIIAFFAFA